MLENIGLVSCPCKKAPANRNSGEVPYRTKGNKEADELATATMDGTCNSHSQKNVNRPWVCSAWVGGLSAFSCVWRVCNTQERKCITPSIQAVTGGNMQCMVKMDIQTWLQVSSKGSVHRINSNTLWKLSCCKICALVDSRIPPRASRKMLSTHKTQPCVDAPWLHLTESPKVDLCAVEHGYGPDSPGLLIQLETFDSIIDLIGPVLCMFLSGDGRLCVIRHDGICRSLICSCIRQASGFCVPLQLWTAGPLTMHLSFCRIYTEIHRMESDLSNLKQWNFTQREKEMGSHPSTMILSPILRGTHLFQFCNQHIPSIAWPALEP